MAGLRLQIVLQRADTGGVEFLELAGVDGPEERPHGHQAQHEAERHEHVEDRHARTRRAFSTTSTELSDIPRAASQGGSQPSAATGIPTRL